MSERGITEPIVEDYIPHSSSTLLPLLSSAKKTDPSEVRTRNRMFILSTVFHEGALSRTQLSDITRLSRVSISEVVANLRESHLLTESGQTQSAGRGKKGALVSLEKDYWRILSLDVSEPYAIRGIVTDIAGTVVDSIDTPIDPPAHITVGRISDVCGQLIERHAQDHILGIGLSVPGIVSSDGVVHESSTLGWSDIHLRAVLEKQYSLPVTVVSDSSACTIAERILYQSEPNALFIQLSSHVSSSVLIDDCIPTGTHYSAGSISHVVADQHGPLCTCGKRGCVDVMYSSSAIRRQFAVAKEDSDTILTSTGESLGKTLALPCVILDVATVILHGPADIITPVFLSAIERSLESSTVHPTSTRIRVRKGTSCLDLPMLGASMSVLQNALRTAL